MNRELLEDPKLTVADRNNLGEIIDEVTTVIEAGDSEEMIKRLDSLINLRATLDVVGEDLVDYAKELQAEQPVDTALKAAIELVFDSNRCLHQVVGTLIGLLEDRVA